MPATFRPITFDFPAFDTFTDEELNIWLGFLDGRWSPLIKSALEKSGATQLELNAPWASMPQVWSCPACDRSKVELLRVTDKGVLVAKLERHHDHLSEYIKSEMDRRFGTGWSLRLTWVDQGHVCGSLNALARRFDDTLICTDCNAADGAVKGQLKGIVDSDFSFRPSEIRLFVEPIPGKTHSINVERAKEIWVADAPDFAKRKELIAVVLDEAARGGLLKQGRAASGFSFDAQSLVMKGIAENASDQAFINESVRHVELRSLSRPAIAQKKRRRVSAPPTAEILSALADVPDSRDWAAAPDDWRCPACGRSRNEIPRKAKSGNWIAQTCRHVEFLTSGDDATEPDDDFSITLRSVERHRHILICRDCADIESRLKRDRPELDLTDSFLTVAEIASVITPAAHVAHDVDWGKAAALAHANKRWSEAVADYWSLFDEAEKVWSYHLQIGREYGGDDETRLDLLARRVKLDYEYLGDGQLRSHLHWLLSRAKDWPGIGKPLELERNVR